ncbi:MAG: serine hydrolase [Phycisphaerales bacterium]|nr:MAG: serine hydrolase [Phycisphaerales bacterium]
MFITRVPLTVSLVTTLLALASTVAGDVQDRPGPTPALSEAFDGFDAYAEKMMDRWEVPGMAVGVIKDGKVIYMDGFGYRNVEEGLAVTPETLFAIGSVSKPFTALSVGMLVDDRKLDWDTPLIEYLPDFRLSDEYATLHATPRDLLAHRTGLPHHYMMIAATPFSRDEIFRRLRFLEPTAELREVYQYNNLMYMTAGYLVGRVTGGTWEEFIAERVFKPLGMERSTFRRDGVTDLDNIALPYEKKRGEVATVPYPVMAAAAPSGGIISSAEEMVEWLRLYLNQGRIGNRQLVSAVVLKEMHTPQMPIRYVPKNALGPIEAYGLGWMIRPYRGHYLVHHGGWIDGFVSWVTMMPDDNIGVVVLSNKGHQLLPFWLNYHIYHRLLDLGTDWTAQIQPSTDEDGSEVQTRPQVGTGGQGAASRTHPLQDYTGVYEHPAYGRVALNAEGGALSIVFNDQTAAPLEHVKYNIFLTKHEIEEFNNLPVRFPVTMFGEIESVEIELQEEVEGRGIDDIVFLRVFDETLRNDAEFLRKIAGQYEFQGVIVKVEYRPGPRLVLQVPGEPEYEMAPYSTTMLKIIGMERSRVEINYDENGRVVEAVVHRPDGSIPARRIQ